MAANLKEVRARIQSVNNTQQITKAMKMVSAAKLRRAQDAIVRLRPYAEHLIDILGNLFQSLEGEEISLEYNKQREHEKVLIVLITSDKGLAGAFNSSLIKITRRLIDEKYGFQKAAGNLHLMAIGKKGFDFFRKDTKINLIEDYRLLFQNLNFDDVAVAAEHAMHGFLNKDFDRIELVFSKFKNAATQEFSTEQFLPVASFVDPNRKNNKRPDYIFEPDKKEMIEMLVPRILKMQFYRALLESNASEHGARMTAMDKATENANELLRDLKIMYNRARQAAITTELTEIVGGASALEQG